MMSLGVAIKKNWCKTQRLLYKILKIISEPVFWSHESRQVGLFVAPDDRVVLQLELAQDRQTTVYLKIKYLLIFIIIC